MRMERAHNHMIRQQRGIAQGKAAPRTSRRPSRHDDACRKIEIDPPTLLVPVVRVVNQGVRPRTGKRLDDLTTRQEF